MRAADLFVRCLENEGVRFVFGIPGEETLDLMDALAESEQIRFVPTRHEQGAAFMANVYGRLSTYPGVCLATLGPGATNLITGVADAFLDRAPLVAITGQAARHRAYKESHQYLDVRALFQPVTKWNARIELPEAIPEVVRKSFRLARLEKPGATHVELPEDVAATRTAGSPMPVRRTTYPAARADAIARAAEVIRGAKRPLLLAGNGVIRRQASEALTRFAEAVRVPVATTFMGKGAIDARHELALPAMGLLSEEASLGPLEEADLVITVGFDFVEWPPEVWNRRGRLHVLHIDSTPAEVDRCYLAAAEVVGELADALRALTEALAGFRAPAWGWEAYRNWYFEGRELDPAAFPLRPERIVDDLRRALGPEDVLIADVGVHKLWVATRYPAYAPNTVVIANGLASMGIAVPGAIAAKLVRPERRVVAVTGDGGFLMNSQELETARRLGTAFVTVVLVDDRFGVIELNQRRRFGRPFGVEFGNPDFELYGRSFGLPAFAVRSADEFLPTLERALALPEPSLIAVPVDSTRSPAVFAESV